MVDVRNRLLFTSPRVLGEVGRRSPQGLGGRVRGRWFDSERAKAAPHPARISRCSMLATLSPQAGRGNYAIAFFRFSSILSRKPVVESHFCSGPTRRARSLVM